MIAYALLFFFNDPATTEIYTLSLHDALPISLEPQVSQLRGDKLMTTLSRSLLFVLLALPVPAKRSEEHTSELQSRRDLVCRLLLEKKNSGRLALVTKVRTDESKSSNAQGELA